MEKTNAEEGPKVTKYDVYAFDSEGMALFLQNSNYFEKIKMYRYVLTRSKQLEAEGTKEAKDKIPFYYLSSLELSNTEAIKKYLSGEITQEMIDKHEAEEQKVIDEIMKQLEERKQSKKGIKYRLQRFLGIQSKKSR